MSRPTYATPRDKGHRLAVTPVPQRLVLFDIDATLIYCGPQVRPFFATALTEAFGTAGDMVGYSFAGKTDPQIVLELMSAAGIERSVILERIPRVREHYLENLAAGLDPGEMQLLPGVVDLLRSLSARGDVAVGLLTGNWEPGGRIKLGRYGLNEFFAFGAFGDDQFDRMNLPQVAFDRAAATTGRRFLPTETLLVADSLLDVACARHSGIPILAVATGMATVDDLVGAGADTVIPDLTATHLYEHLLG